MTYKYTFDVTDWSKDTNKETKVFNEKLEKNEIRELLISFLDRKDVKHVNLKSLHVIDGNGDVVEKETNFNKY